MEARRPREPRDVPGWRRWTVAALGAVLGALAWLHLYVDDDAGFGDVVEFLLPLAGALAVAGLGVRLARGDATVPEIDAVARWSGGGAAVVGLLGGWVFYLGTREGLPADEVTLYASTAAAVGGMMGTAIGVYDARQARALRAAERARRELSVVVENAPVVVFALDETGEFTLSKGRGLAALGLETGDLVGTSIYEAYGDNRAVLDAVDAALSGEAVAATMPVEDRHFETWFEPVTADGEVTGVIGVARDVTDRRAQERRLEALHEASRELSYATTVEEVGQATVDIAGEVLDEPLSTFWEYDADADRLELVASSEATERFLADAGVGELPAIERGDLGMEVFEAGEFRAVKDYATVDNPAFPELPLGTVLLAPVGDHGLLELGAREATTVSESERYHAEVLAGNAATALDRVARERHLRERRATIEALHERTREMVTAGDRTAVAERVVETADEVLDLPLTSVWLVDGTGTRLEPAAWTDAVERTFGELPTYTDDDDSISWRAYATGEARLVEDVAAEPAAHDPESPAGSELVVPLGEHGVLNAGAVERDAFTEEDLGLARLVAANAVAALERVDREAQLRQQTSRMEFFNSILRHDVLNGMTVIRARGAVLADELDGTHGDYAATIVEWCDDVVDVVGRVRTVLERLTGEGSVEPERVDLAALLGAELDRIRATYPAVDLSVDVPDGVEVLADDLLAEVLGNLLTNAVEHNDPEDLRVRVTAEVGPETVTVRVEDDGKGVPEGMRDAVFRRGETAHAKSTGSGFGLFFVDSMVAEYGGDVSVEDSDMGGAAFVLELPRPAEPSPFRPAEGEEREGEQ